jgi:hypothetical protein
VLPPCINAQLRLHSSYRMLHAMPGLLWSQFSSHCCSGQDSIAVAICCSGQDSIAVAFCSTSLAASLRHVDRRRLGEGYVGVCKHFAECCVLLGSMSGGALLTAAGLAVEVWLLAILHHHKVWNGGCVGRKRAGVSVLFGCSLLLSGS